MSDPTFDPDAFLAQPDAAPVEDFDPDAFLADQPAADGFGELTALPVLQNQPDTFDRMMPGGFESDLVAPTAQRFAPTYVQAPQEVDLSAYPKLKDVVETEKRISGFTRALQSVGQFFADVKEANAAREAFTRNIEDAQASWAAPETQQQLAATRALQDRKGWLDLAVPFSEGLPLDKLAELDVAPGKVRELDSPEAAAIRNSEWSPLAPLTSGPFAIAAQRNLEAQRQLEVSKVAYEEWESAAFGKENPAATARRRELEAQLPLNLREEGAAGLLVDVVAGSESTLQAAGETAKGAGVGGLAAGLGTLAATRNPAAARTAAQLGAKVGGLQGAANFTFRLETGSTFRDSEKWVGSDGKPLSLQERAGAAFLSGALKTGIELVEFSMLAKALGPATKTLTVEGAASLRATIARDPSMRALLVRAAKTWAKTTLPEVAEEGAQELTDQAVESAFTGKSAFNPTKVTEAVGQSFLPAALTFGPLGAVVNFGAELGTLREYRKAGAQVPHLLALAAEPEMQKSPVEFAKLAGEASGGKTALYVQGEALQRFFQERSDDPTEGQRQLEEALGPGGADKVTEAVATGGFVEVPLEAVPRWAAHEAAAALTDDTTTHPEAPTPRELRAGGAALEEAAKAQADAFLAQAADGQAFDAKVKEWEAQQVVAGQSKRDAKVGALVLRHLVATAAKDSGKSPLEVLGDSDFAFAVGDEQAAVQGERLNQQDDWVPNILAAAQQLEQLPEGRVRAAFFDTLTGLRNRRGFDTEHQPGAGVVVALTSTDSKPINDTVSHTQTNRLFRAIGGLVGAVDQKAARAGTTFLFRAETPEAARIAVETWRAQLPPNLALSLGFGEDSSTAMADLEDQVDTGRAKGRVAEQKAAEPTDAELLAEFPDAPALPAERTGTKLDLQGLKLDEGAALTNALTPELQQASDSRFTSTGVFAKDQFLDQATGGVIFNDRGFEAAGERAYVAAFDGIGLKALNEKFTAIGRERLGMARREAKAWGRKMGDFMLVAIAQTAHKMGGAGVSFARKSGDEFAAKSDNLAELNQFVADLKAEFQAIDLKLPDGSIVTVPVDARWGIGEKTYEAADIDLNRRKADVAKGGPGGASDLPGSGSADQRAGRAESRGLLDPSRLDQPAEAGRVPAAPGAAGSTGEVERLKQDNAGAAPKGYFEAPEAIAAKQVFRVFLNKSADLSTVVHESSHAWLEFYRQLAAAPDATDTVKAKWADIAKWLDAGEGRLTREQHEKFARSFEAYLFEGKAPKKELARAFNTLKRWLVSLYRTVQGIPGADLNDDARRVFDALLATDDEVQAYQRAQGPQAFATAEEAGVTDAEWQAQLEAQRDAVSEGSQRAARAAMKDALRVHEKWWKDGLKKLRAIFADEYEALPGVRAQRFLKQAKLEVTDDNAGQVAELLGFASVPELRTALAEVPDKAAWVEAHASSEMAAQHPGVLERRDELRALVADGLNAYTEKRLLDERAAFRRNDPKVGAAPVAVLRRAAALIVEKTPLGRLSPGLALSRERAAAVRAQKAAAKGKWAEASKANTEQLLNHYLHAELLQAREVRGQLEAAAKALSKKAARERLGKASPVYRDAVDFLLGAVGLGDESGLDAGTLDQAAAQMAGDAVWVGDPPWLESVKASLVKSDYRQLTVAEGQQLRDALENLWAAARKRTEVMLDGKAADFEEVKSKLLEEIPSYLRKMPAKQEEHAQGLARKALLKFSAFDGFLGAPMEFLRDLTNDNQSSTVWRALALPFKRAVGREADLLSHAVRPITDAMEKMPARVRDSAMDRIDGRALFPGHGEDYLPTRRYELWVMLLNAGNTSNLRLLTEARNITVDQIQRVADMMSKEELEWVQSVWDACESMKDEAFDLEERLTGLRPQAITPTPLRAKNGDLRGGYFPAKAIRGDSPVGEHQASDFFDPSYVRPGTQHGHLKSRNDSAQYRLSLDLNGVFSHLRQVAHDTAFREVLQSFGRLLMDPDIKLAMQQRLGEAKWEELYNWGKDIGGASQVDNSPAAQVMQWIRKNMAPMMLSGFSTALGNFSNWAMTVATTKVKAKHLAAAVVECARSPEVRAAAYAKSGTLRAMENEIVQGFERQMSKLTSGKVKRGLRRVQEATLWLSRTIDSISTMHAWVAAYRQAMEENPSDEGAAIRFADDIVTQVAPSSSAVEQAGVLRDKKFWGKMAMFHSFISRMYQATHRAARPLFSQEFEAAGIGGKALTAAKVTGTVVGMTLAYGALNDIFAGRGPDDDDRDGEDPDNKLLKWRNWMARKVLGQLLSLTPFFPGQSVVDSVAKGKPMQTPRSDPLTSTTILLGDTVLRVLAGQMSEAEFEKRMLKLAGVVGGVPVRLGDTSVRYGIGLATGEESPESVSEAAGNLVYGKRKADPDDIFSVAADIIDAVAGE